MGRAAAESTGGHDRDSGQHGGNEHFATGLVRAFGGAIVFSVPTLMTMEMWQLGFAMGPWRLALLMVATLPMLAGFSYFGGFEDTFDWREDVIDAFVAYAVGFATAGALLPLFGVVGREDSLDEVVGKIAIEAIACSIGAMLARSQFGQNSEPRDQPGFGGNAFIALIGALFLALNVAPTEEVVLIAYRMGPWQTVGLAVLTVSIMHLMVYAAQFRGQVERDRGWLPLFLRSTVTAYAVSLLSCLYLLWSFGRTDGDALPVVLSITVVLGFPAGVGAAAARLIL